MPITSCPNCAPIGNVNDLISHLRELRELIVDGETLTAIEWLNIAIQRLEKENQ
jgi:hypothetical protein